MSFTSLYSRPHRSEGEQVFRSVVTKNNQRLELRRCGNQLGCDTAGEHGSRRHVARVAHELSQLELPVAIRGDEDEDGCRGTMEGARELGAISRDELLSFGRSAWAPSFCTLNGTETWEKLRRQDQHSDVLLQ